MALVMRKIEVIPPQPPRRPIGHAHQRWPINIGEIGLVHAGVQTGMDNRLVRQAGNQRAHAVQTGQAAANGQ